MLALAFVLALALALTVALALARVRNSGYVMVTYEGVLFTSWQHFAVACFHSLWALS